MINPKPLLLLIVTMALMNSGCLLRNAEVSPSYSASPIQKSPLEKLRPVNVALLVEDQRPPEERESFGRRRNVYGSVVAQVISPKTVAAVFYDALASELQNNGHRVTVAPSDTSQRTINVEVKRYWTENRMNFFDITMTATAYADVTIQDPRSATSLAKRSLTGIAEESRQLASEGAYQDALNKALLEFIRSFARDTEVIKALQVSNPNN